jgi:hypothetical protein
MAGIDPLSTYTRLNPVIMIQRNASIPGFGG